MKRLVLFLISIVAIPVILTFGASLLSDKVNIGCGGNSLESRLMGKEVLIEISGLYKSIDVEEYVLGVLTGTIPADYDIETLKVQAILVRTNVLKEMQEKNTSDAADLSYQYLTVEDRITLWGDKNYEKYERRFEKAVADTAGMVIWQENSLIMALYHEVSIGKTASAKEILGEDISYLQSVESSQDVEAKHYMNLIVYTWEELNALLHSTEEMGQTQGDASQTNDETAQAEEGVSQTNDETAQAEEGVPQTSDETAQAEEGVSQTSDETAQAEEGVPQTSDETAQAEEGVPQTSDETAQAEEGVPQASDETAQAEESATEIEESEQMSGTISISVEESTENGFVKKLSVGGNIYTGEEAMQQFGLSSTNFYVEEIENGVRFVCLGKGSCLGISQYGANRMAIDGKKTEEIIKYYYQGVSVMEYTP